MIKKIMLLSLLVNSWIHAMEQDKPEKKEEIIEMPTTAQPAAADSKISSFLKQWVKCCIITNNAPLTKEQFNQQLISNISEMKWILLTGATTITGGLFALVILFATKY